MPFEGTREMREGKSSLRIKIHSLGSSGEGVGKLDELIIFVEGALPSEEILAEVVTRSHFSRCIKIAAAVSYNI